MKEGGSDGGREGVSEGWIQYMHSIKHRFIRQLFHSLILIYALNMDIIIYLYYIDYLKPVC